MKTQIIHQTLALTMLIFSVVSPEAKGMAEAEIKQAEMKHCSLQKCLSLKGYQAVTGNLSSIIFFRAPMAELMDKKTGKTLRFENLRSAYFDPTNNQIVLTQTEKNVLVERAFNMSSLEEKVYRSKIYGI